MTLYTVFPPRPSFEVRNCAAVKKEKECKNGQVIVARINDEVTVKTFRTNEEGMIILEPANEDFPNIIINPAEEEFFLEGICLGVIKKF